jgi:hypothetical protein
MNWMARSVLIALGVLAIVGAAQVRRVPQQTRGAPQEVQPTASFKGVLKAVEGGKILLEMPDGNIMEFRTSRKSKFTIAGKEAKWKDLPVGQPAEVDGRHVLGIVEAVTVNVTKTAVEPKP